jgi:hypothetical protein
MNKRRKKKNGRKKTNSSLLPLVRCEDDAILALHGEARASVVLHDAPFRENVRQEHNTQKHTHILLENEHLKEMQNLIAQE